MMVAAFFRTNGGYAPKPPRYSGRSPIPLRRLRRRAALFARRYLTPQILVLLLCFGGVRY